ncbi:TolC family protein [Salegentibacter sp. JZCK2]|uniref:TolC family protein n=1 Tax=Salegentibacter tibetensis TaxID=2873600 RepID=UPI001CCE1F63|nr:TolC family protein [Salegentibacter tibetensis]MBZ9730863.1 TolC family protein [Salegentibacter tibetensis]
MENLKQKENKIQQLCWCCILLLSSIWFTSAQEQVVELDLPAVLEVGGADNLSIDRYEKEQELAEANYLKAKSWWLPDLSLGVRSEHLWGAAMNADGGFFLEVERNNLWLGPEMNLSWDFGKDIYKLKAEELKLRAADFETREEKNQAILRGIEVYYEFKNAQLSRTAYDRMAEIADTVSMQLEIQVDAGFRYQSEVLTSQSNTKHLQIQSLESEKEFLEKQEELRELLDVNATVELRAADDLLLPLELISEDELMNITPDSAVGRRPGIEAIDNRILATKEEKKQVTTGLLLPKLSIGAYTSYFGGFFETVTPMRAEQEPSPQSLYPTTAIQASLIWDIPLGQIFYKGEPKRYDAVIGLQKNEREQFENKVTREVKSARAKLINSKRQLEIAEESEELAREALSQSIERQKSGTAAPFEVFQAQEYYLRSRLDYLMVVSQYNTVQYQLYVALGNDL